MFKRITVILLLCNFINTVLFTTETIDATPNNGKEEVVEEINSLVEFVVQDCMDIPDDTPEDEDDDQTDPFKTEKTLDTYTYVSYSLSETEVHIETKNWHIKPSAKPFALSKDILSPPPRIS